MQKQVLISIRHKARFTQVLTHPRLVDSKMLHRFPEIDEILSHTRKTSQPTTTSKNPKTLASVSGFVICSIFACCATFTGGNDSNGTHPGHGCSTVNVNQDFMLSFCLPPFTYRPHIGGNDDHVPKSARPTLVHRALLPPLPPASILSPRALNPVLAIALLTETLQPYHPVPVHPPSCEPQSRTQTGR